MKPKLLILFLMVCLPSLVAAQSPQIEVSLTNSGEAKLLASFTVPKGLYLYQDMIEVSIVSPKTVVLKEPQFPKGITKKDQFTGEDRVVYEKSAIVPVEIKIRPAEALSLKVELSYQACTDVACLLPQVKEFTIELPGYSEASPAAAGSSSAPAKAPKGSTTAEGLMAA